MIDWLDELRLEPGPPYGVMGTHALSLDRWLLVDEHRPAELMYKARLLETARSQVFAALAGSEPAADELHGLVRTWLGSRGLQPAEPAGDEHPVIEAARLVQEDLAVLERRDGRWIVTAGAVCFPTHWCIADKVGLSVAETHAPVAHFDTELREKLDRFHDRLMPEHPVWRRNWVVIPTRELHLPEYDSDRHVPDRIEANGSPMWLRSERQTLRRLPATGAIVFTIRVQLAPLGVLRSRPDLAARMLAATRSWDGPKREYTSTGGVLDELIVWLERVAAGETAPAGGDTGKGATPPP